MSARERDGVDVPAIIALAELGRAAIAEEALRFREGVEAKILDLADAGTREPRPDVAGQIEHGAAAVALLEEAVIALVLRDEALDEFRPDLVAVLPDQRSD